MKKILLLWYMENDNFGDTLLADTTITILEENGFQIENCEVGANPSEIIELANKCDFLLFAGGGIIERYIPPILRRFSEYVNELKIPYGVIGVSVGNFNYDYKSISLGVWVDNALFFYVRDNHSKDVLNGYSKTNKVKYSGDCVFLTRRIEGYKNTNAEMVGINVRDLPYEDLTGKLDVKKIIDIVKLINVDMVIMDSSEEIGEILIKESDIERYNEYLKKNKLKKVEQIIKEISECNIIVAMRYHVILVAALMGIPAVSIKYCPKIERLVEQLGISELAVSVGDYDDISKKMYYAREHYDEYRELILANVERMKLRVEKMYQEVLDIMKQVE